MQSLKLFFCPLFSSAIIGSSLFSTCTLLGNSTFFLKCGSKILFFFLCLYGKSDFCNGSKRTEHFCAHTQVSEVERKGSEDSTLFPTNSRPDGEARPAGHLLSYNRLKICKHNSKEQRKWSRATNFFFVTQTKFWGEIYVVCTNYVAMNGLSIFSRLEYDDDKGVSVCSTNSSFPTLGYRW